MTISEILYYMWAESGPAFYVLALWQLAIFAAIWRTLRRIQSGEPASAVPVLLTLMVPLGIAFVVSTVFVDSGMNWAASVTDPMAAATIQAMAIGRGIFTQMFAGLLTAGSAALLIGGCIAVASPSERPRLGIAAVAASLTWVLVVVLMTSSSFTPTWAIANPGLLSGFRVSAYLAAGLAATGALLTSHKRGPGASVGLIAAAALPFVVVGGDAVAMSLVSLDAFSAAAHAAAADKGAIIEGAREATFIFKYFSGVHVVLALALAALGPIAAKAATREDAPDRMKILGLGATYCALAVSTSALWFQWV